MRLIDIRMRNFRSIAEEQVLPISPSVTIVGPNNSGKTNALRAIQMLFTGHENRLGYSQVNDLFEGAGSERTTLSARFDGDPGLEDKWFYDDLDELHRLQGTKRTSNEVTIHLYFTESGTPVYNFFPNIRRPTERKKAVKYSKVARDLVVKFVDSFSVHYVPSNKSIDLLYRELITPFLRETVAGVLNQHRGELQDKLDQASQHVTDQMGAAGCGAVDARFIVPSGSMAALLSHFDFNLADPFETPYSHKGMGVQAAAVFATLSWITEQERSKKKSVIWLLEEPESYLHPSLSSACYKLLQQLSTKASVVMTTHSLTFVPSDPKFVRGAERREGRTVLISYRTSFDAGNGIRSSLGVKFGDYFGFGSFNLFVEGATDRELIQWVLKKLPEPLFPFRCLRAANIQDFGGVRHLSGFLRATYAIFQHEVASVSMFDGDDAGVKERKDLQGYFGQKGVPFRANHEFVSVRDRFPVEGLFPDEWVIHLQAQRPAWFDYFSVDASGALEPFRLKDGSKSNFIETMMSWANQSTDLNWAERFIAVCSAIDRSLLSQADKVAR